MSINAIEAAYKHGYDDGYADGIAYMQREIEETFGVETKEKHQPCNCELCQPDDGSGFK